MKGKLVKPKRTVLKRRKDLKFALWILGVGQPKSGEVYVISIETDMKEGLLDICGQAISEGSNSYDAAARIVQKWRAHLKAVFQTRRVV